MRSWMTRMLVATVALAAGAAGPATSALAQPHHHAVRHHAVLAHKADPPETPGEAPESGAADNDEAAQAAACQKAGIDPNGPNVQYDDQTGTCSTDGGNSGQQQ
jgi:hypothetical protein